MQNQKIKDKRDFDEMDKRYYAATNVAGLLGMPYKSSLRWAHRFLNIQGGGSRGITTVWSPNDIKELFVIKHLKAAHIPALKIEKILDFLRSKDDFIPGNYVLISGREGQVENIVEIVSEGVAIKNLAEGLKLVAPIITLENRVHLKPQQDLFK